MKTHILFDFDGTLVDSAPAILVCFSRVLQKHGLKACRSIDTSLIGPPLRQTLAALVGQSDPVLLDTLSASFKEIYDTEACLETPAYVGCQATLEHLFEQGFNLAIATNKRLFPTQKIITALGWEHLFIEVFASDSHPGCYVDKSGMVASLLHTRAIPSQAAIYIGDTEGDSQAAAANGIDFWPVAWGYGHFDQHDQLLGSPKELLERLLRMQD